MRLSTSLDHVRTGRSVPWASLLGLVLVPLPIAGLLVWSLYDPQARLNTVTAAIVNEDVPVEVNGQLAPLGRQLTAGLVGTEDTAAATRCGARKKNQPTNANRPTPTRVTII